ncbi:signal peptidase II [Peredibacter sp. HCB2-198]|uniref:signal peptidase II n=1 Tax=Peredibacter sp. HCB2-198 TaxID=3383025 RepID=UPI0038B4FA61
MLTSHKRAFLAYVPFLLFWGLDYVTKSWIVGNQPELQWGPFHIAYHENHGVILGSFKDIPEIFRSVFLSTIGLAIVSSYPMLLNLVHFHSKRMQFGVALLFGGIMGNVTDRVLYGYVVDLFYLKTNWFTTPAFNLADLVQWVAYILIATAISGELNRHVPEGDRRKFQWIMPSFQYKFCLALVALVFFVTSIPLVFGLTFLKYTLSASGVFSEREMTAFLSMYLITSFSLQMVLCLGAVIIGKILSSRVAGPILGIRRYLQDTLNGKNYGFKLRDKDPFKELEKPLTELNHRVTRDTESNDRRPS